MPGSTRHVALAAGALMTASLAFAQSEPSVVRPPLSNSGFVLVSPTQPRPQEPFQLGFNYAAAAVGYSGVPTVELGDSNIDVFLADPCAEAGAQCPGRRSVVLTVDVPGVEFGSYNVRVFAGRNSSSSLAQIGRVEVSALSRPGFQPLPAEGYWAAASQPGSGFMLDRQGPVWAVGLFNYLPPAVVDVPPDPSWQLALGTLRRDSLLAAVDFYAGGTCYGCAGPAPTSRSAVGMIRLRLASARRGYLTINGSPEVAVASIPFGARYVGQGLTDGGDPDFGPLRLPDPRGEWLLADDLGQSLRLKFDEAPQLFDTSAPGTTAVRFFGTGSSPQTLEVAFACLQGAVTNIGNAFPPQPATCVLSGGPSRAASTAFALGEFELGNIEEDRMQGRLVRNDGIVVNVVAHRISAAPPVVEPQP